MAKRDGTSTFPESRQPEEPSELLRELVAHLRQNRTQLREEWVVRITETRLLYRDDQGRNLRGSHLGLRQLR